MDKELNGAGSFTFSLPLTDPKAIHLKERNHIKVFKQGSTTPVFDGRIVSWTKIMSEDGSMQADVTCEGFATTLNEHIWPSHRVWWNNFVPAQVYSDVLARQSAISLGTIEVDTKAFFEYSYDNFQYMIYKVPSILGGDIEVDGNRKLNHWKQMGKDLGVRIEYGFNLRTINVNIDSSELATRLYGLGSSEGVNQTDIKSVNGGLEYLDADTQGIYGIVERVLIDREITDPNTLKLKMQNTLDQIKNPTKSFEITAVNLAELTGYEHTAFTLGDTLLIRHKDLGIEDKVRIVRITQDLDNPEEVTLEISNKTKDLSDFLSELKSKQETMERYPQGSMNIFVASKEVNVDNTHPLTLRFPMPVQIKRTARVLLGLRGLKFQTFTMTGGASNSTTTKSNSQQTSGSSSETTTATDNSETVSTDTPAEWASQGHTHSLEYHPITNAITGVGNQENLHSHHMFHHHGMVHTHTIAGHTHDMSHTHIQNVSIYESTYPSYLTLWVDGVEYTDQIQNKGFNRGWGDAINWDNFDIAQWLNPNWSVHEVVIGTASLGRLDVWVIPQVLVASE